MTRYSASAAVVTLFALGAAAHGQDFLPTPGAPPRTVFAIYGGPPAENHQDARIELPGPMIRQAGASQPAVQAHAPASRSCEACAKPCNTCSLPSHPFLEAVDWARLLAWATYVPNPVCACKACRCCHYHLTPPVSSYLFCPGGCQEGHAPVACAGCAARQGCATCRPPLPASGPVTSHQSAPAQIPSVLPPPAPPVH
jgi:hypothetical protein